MTWFEVVFLAVVQALTEFLPVSSSAHLRLARELSGSELRVDLAFDLVLHLGTLLAVVVFYWRDIKYLLDSLLTGIRAIPAEGVQRALRHEGLSYAVLLGIAMAPTGVIGLALRKLVSSDALSSTIIGTLLLLNAGILVLPRLVAKMQGTPLPVNDAETATTDAAPPAVATSPMMHISRTTVLWALVIGTVQGLAVFPGISRSGSTIVAGLLLGMSRPDAARFSFLLSLPTIFLASMVELYKDGGVDATIHAGQLLVGVGLSFGLGLAALWMLKRLIVDRDRFPAFAAYCVAAGLAALFLLP